VEPAWPTTATPGGAEPAAPIQTAEPQQPAAAGGLDAGAIRHSWDAVLDAVKERKKTTHAQLLNAHVQSLQGSKLTLAFTHAPVMRQFQNGVSVDVLKDALQVSLGVALEIVCVVSQDAAAQSPSRQASVQPSDGFAPGDEAAPEDPDAPPPPEAARNGEDAALRLIESELGGKVVGTVGD
jgi:hypothetical protein